MLPQVLNTRRWITAQACYVYGAPGTQKTHVLQHLIAELNRSEIAKNGAGRRAFYVYVLQGVRSLEDWNFRSRRSKR